MSVSLHELSVVSSLRVVEAVDGFLQKGAAQAGLDLQALVEARVHEDMLPFRFQLISVMHHSIGSVRGIRAGESAPPPDLGEPDYAGLQELIRNTAAELRSVSPDEFNALAGGKVVFKVGGREIPFTAENFVLSFSQPNLHFHATVAYGLLRNAGVPLGKLDYLGAMKTGV